MRLRSLFATALAGISIFLAVYVAYAHLASIVNSGQYVLEPTICRFSSEDAVEREFASRQHGPLRADVADGRLRITGTTTVDDAGPAELELVGPVRKLAESRLRMRFRVRNAAAYDLMIGIEKAAEGPARSLRFGLANGLERPRYRLVGDDGGVLLVPVAPQQQAYHDEQTDERECRREVFRADAVEPVEHHIQRHPDGP